MSEVVNSWPWYDRAIFGAAVTGLFYGPYIISKQLATVIRLLEAIANKK